MGPVTWYEPDGTPAPALIACLRAAVAAPSIHNTQPWRFRLRGTTIDVLADRDRQLSTLDPQGREMLVSVGAALFNLRVAVRGKATDPRVRLLPDRAERDLVATVDIADAAGGPSAAQRLAAAIPYRHTNRYPFADRALPCATLRELAGAAAAEGATLLTVGPTLRGEVLGLTGPAQRRQRRDPHYHAEFAAWTADAGAARMPGVAWQVVGPRERGRAMPVRDFAVGHGLAAATVTFEPEPHLIMLFTAGDTPADWLRAGAALQRVLLTATLRGLAATPLSQLVEVPRLRALLADFPGGQVVQSVLRIGYATTAARPSPRRPVSDVMLIR